MQTRDRKYLLLDDGRKLCLECLDSAVMDTNECQPLYIEIKNFFEGLHMKVEQEIPMLLVERQALNVAMDGEKNVNANIFILQLCTFISFGLHLMLIFILFLLRQGHHHMRETRGLCLSEEQTVTTVGITSPVFNSCHFSCNDICILYQTSITSSTMLPDL